MKLELNEKKHNITFNNETIEVYERISTEDKISMITIAIEQAINFGPVPSRAAFEATLGGLICYKYSNIEIENLGDKSILYAYDVFRESGFLSTLIKEIDKDDYNTLIKFADDTFETAITYYNSGASILETALKIGLTAQAEQQEEEK